MAKFVGLSVSFCIRDIVEGDVAEDDVKFIVAGTRIRNTEEYESVVESYSEYYWKEHVEEARAVFKRLWDAGKIIQPRLLDLPAPNIAGGTWLVSAPGPHGKHLDCGTDCEAGCCPLYKEEA
jgi:hypothetical protein